MKHLFFVVLFFFGLNSYARIEAQFHPYDPTFVKIAEHIGQAKKSIDIAMYNMDSSSNNAVIAKISSAEIQQRIQAKELQIRLLFEGYRGSPKQEEKLKTFESMGIDVRFLGSGKKMHHKFALIDIETVEPVLISGSANWSLFSLNNYNENILFFEGEEEIAELFHREFEFLWDISQDYGANFTRSLNRSTKNKGSSGVEAFFNTDNFKLHSGRLVDDSSKEGFILTRKLVEEIDQAREKIEIATTRIKLRPVYEALVRAAQRGVRIQIVVTMDEYETKGFRDKKDFPECPSLYSKDCSTSHNYSVFLGEDDFSGHENIEVRFKFFNLNLREHLSYQMHSKYAIIDDRTLLTGSFNWSYSAEYGHIENLIVVDGASHPGVIRDFQLDFERVYNLNRSSFEDLVAHFERKVESSREFKCSFEPISLHLEEIDRLYEIDDHLEQSFKDMCR